VLLGGGQIIAALAAEAKVVASYFTRVLRLGFLAPAVVTAILQGRQPPELTAKQLSLHIRLPIGWTDQVAALGIR
jgi:site-specific DNA recombinase